MVIPFTIEQFHVVFRDYNTALWPAQLFLLALAGIALIADALVLYPVWSAYSGHSYPETATFGLPCPTTIFTIGVLCFAGVGIFLLATARQPQETHPS